MVTEHQVQAFLETAGQAGDMLAVAICQRALGVAVSADLAPGEIMKLDHRWPTREAACAEVETMIADGHGR